jgi:phosphotransferase system enzyme I (PtsP)
MSANGLLKVKSMLNQVPQAEARSLAKRALRMPDAESVSLFLSDALNRPELSKLYRPVVVEKS